MSLLLALQGVTPQTQLLRDEALPVEEKAGIRRDESLPVDEIRVLTRDEQLLLEAIVVVAESVGLLVESRGALARSEDLPVDDAGFATRLAFTTSAEYGAQFPYGAREYGQTTVEARQRDDALPVEDRGALARDESLPTENEAAVTSRDQDSMPVEILTTVAASVGLPVEDLGTMASGEILPVEAGAFVVDQGEILPVEDVGTLQRNETLPIEDLLALDRDDGLPIEIVAAAVQLGFVTSAEYGALYPYGQREYGQTDVQVRARDEDLPVEVIASTAAQLRRDEALPVEDITTLARDETLPVEMVPTVVTLTRDEDLPVEDVGTLARDEDLPLEFTTPSVILLVRDEALPVESLQAGVEILGIAFTGGAPFVRADVVPTWDPKTGRLITPEKRMPRRRKKKLGWVVAKMANPQVTAPGVEAVVKTAPPTIRTVQPVEHRRLPHIRREPLARSFIVPRDVFLPEPARDFVLESIRDEDELLLLLEVL